MTSSQQLDATFAALADPTRRAIVARLAVGEASVNELVEPFPLSQPAISRHLKVLERAGLITGGREAQRRPRRLEGQPLALMADWLENYRQFWEGQFQNLDVLLDEMKSKASRGRDSAPPEKIGTAADLGAAGKSVVRGSSKEKKQRKKNKGDRK